MRLGKLILTAIAVGALSLNPVSVKAFSLLGPFPSWMADTNLLRDPQDIGGPMQKSEAYRRNLSVLTYGFDKSFLDYFGEPGVKAVESAIRTLDAIPPASRINVNRYPTNTAHRVGGVAVMDLKLVTLNALLQQLGLAPSTRYVWTLRRMDFSLLPYFLDESGMSQDQINNCMLRLNYDPQTYQATRIINNTWYSFDLIGLGPGLGQWISLSRVGSPATFQILPISDGKLLDYGVYCTGLTRDDVGGLKFLLSSNNIHVESLDSSIIPRGTLGQTIPRTGPRPGVEKIWFGKHPTDRAGNFRSITVSGTIPVLSRYGWKNVPMLRRIRQPDILFSAAGLLSPPETWPNITYALQYFQSTDTSHWENNAALNRNRGGDGPGVIAGRTKITFQTNTLAAWPEGAHWSWGRFFNDTNYVVFGPAASN